MGDGERCLCIEFDADGPFIGSCRLLAKTDEVFRPRSAQDLAGDLANAPSDVSSILAFPWLEAGLRRVATAMNAGDFGLAAIAACQLSTDMQKARRRTDLSKASPDDPRHPGYPAGAPDDKGGQFRPTDQLPAGDIAFAALTAPGSKAHRLAQRRSVRAALKRVLSTRRLLRLLGENAAAALSEEIPAVDVLMTGAAIEDDLSLIRDLEDAVSGSDAALEMAEQGAVDLQDLQVRNEDLSFDSFCEFKEIELQKQFGAAGDGLDYHHLAEQGPNSGLIAQTDLQSTGNIIKLPRLIHEEVNSYFSTSQNLNGVRQSPRNFLQGKSFEEQKDFGIDTLRTLGVIK